MSALDEIFKPVYAGSFDDDSVTLAKQQIKDLFIELIEQKDPTKQEYYGERVNVDMQVAEMFRNEMSGRHMLQAELRRKIEEL